MTARWQVHSIPKPGSDEQQNEDAVAGPITDGGVVRVAIADGATESAYAARWATLLAHEAAEHALTVAIERARQRFAKAHVASEPFDPWYLQEKRAEGAFAAVIRFELGEEGRWAAEAVGDCVLFHLRSGDVVSTWPIDDPTRFDTRPALVGSHPRGALSETKSTSGAWQPGDRFALATDALAAHMLSHGPGAALGLSDDGFMRYVETARRSGLRNDDLTLVELAIE